MSETQVTPKEQALKLFPDLVIFDKKEMIENRFTGEIVELEPEAVAVYDLTIGAEMCGIHSIVQKGLSWFIEYYPREYMILLD